MWESDGTDFGLKSLEFLFNAMMVDDEWSIKGERSFRWWGHLHCQRIWAEPPREDQGESISLIHVETDLLREVQDNPETYRQLNNLQFLSSLYALIYLPAERKIKLHSTAYVHGGNFGWLSRLMQNAAGIQLCDSLKFGLLINMFKGAKPDITGHPYNGIRENADELVLGLFEYYTSQGRTQLTIPPGEWEAACKVLAKLSVLATPNEKGLTAEFHFVGSDPAILRQMKGKKGVATSILQICVDVGHLPLGFGINSVLVLPLIDPLEKGYRRCNRLNVLESKGGLGFHQLGSWRAWDKEDGTADIAFASFVPAYPCQPGLIANLSLPNGLRSTWASTTLKEHGVK
jgi:hypothetical protein